MTIITAISNNKNETIIGWNNGLTICNDSYLPNISSPWTFFNDWALGITGPSIAKNIIRLNINKVNGEIDDPSIIIATIQGIFSDCDFGLKLDEDVYWTYDVTGILVKKNGGIWDIDCALCHTEIPPNILWARGSGSKYAIGADTVIREMDMKLTMEERIRASTLAATKNDIHSGGEPITKRI